MLQVQTPDDASQLLVHPVERMLEYKLPSLDEFMRYEVKTLEVYNNENELAEMKAREGRRNKSVNFFYQKQGDDDVIDLATLQSIFPNPNLQDRSFHDPTYERNIEYCLEYIG